MSETSKRGYNEVTSSGTKFSTYMNVSFLADFSGAFGKYKQALTLKKNGKKNCLT
jgi:hypothetical protein